MDDVHFPEFGTTTRAPVNVLRAWNSLHPFNSYFYDKKFLGEVFQHACDGSMKIWTYSDEDLDERGIFFHETFVRDSRQS